MKKKCLLMFLLFILSRSSIIQAQQSGMYPLLAMEVRTTAVGSDTTTSGAPILPDSMLFSTHMLVSLFDTINIARVHVKLGTSEGNYDLLQTSFDFDAPNANYSRTDYNIDLNLGNYMGLFDFYSEVKIEKTDGSFSTPALFSNR